MNAVHIYCVTREWVTWRWLCGTHVKDIRAKGHDARSLGAVEGRCEECETLRQGVRIQGCGAKVMPIEQPITEGTQ